MRNIQKENLERSRLQIPLMFMTDIVHGYQTIFPVPLAMAGSFDPEWSGNVPEYLRKKEVPQDIK